MFKLLSLGLALSIVGCTTTAAHRKPASASCLEANEKRGIWARSEGDDVIVLVQGFGRAFVAEDRKVSLGAATLVKTQGTIVPDNLYSDGEQVGKLTGINDHAEIEFRFKKSQCKFSKEFPEVFECGVNPRNPQEFVSATGELKGHEVKAAAIHTEMTAITYPNGNKIYTLNGDMAVTVDGHPKTRSSRIIVPNFYGGVCPSPAE